MEELKERKKVSHKKEISKAKRNNAKIYPMYKMFSWDLLCFYSVEFLFLTMTKNITPSQVLIAEAFYIISKIVMQIPAVTISDILGKRKSIIIGNILLIVYMLTLIFAPRNDRNYNSKLNMFIRI